MMKYKERDINKRVTIQQYPQQTSTKSFACQKRKKIVYCIFNFLFPLFGIIFNRVNKINNGMNNRKIQLK